MIKAVSLRLTAFCCIYGNRFSQKMPLRRNVAAYPNNCHTFCLLFLITVVVLSISKTAITIFPPIPAQKIREPSSRTPSV